MTRMADTNAKLPTFRPERAEGQSGSYGTPFGTITPRQPFVRERGALPWNPPPMTAMQENARRVAEELRRQVPHSWIYIPVFDMGALPLGRMRMRWMVNGRTWRIAVRNPLQFERFLRPEPAAPPSSEHVVTVELELDRMMHADWHEPRPIWRIDSRELPLLRLVPEFEEWRPWG